MSSVPNVRKAMATGALAQGKRRSDINQTRVGTEGSKLNDRIGSVLRGPKRRNS